MITLSQTKFWATVNKTVKFPDLKPDAPYEHHKAVNKLSHRVEIQPNGCWYWRGCITENGYGRLYIGSKPYGAHVASAILFKDYVVTKGLLVMHTCDNRQCVNPDHLIVGTASDNRQDCARKGRDHSRVPRERCLSGHPLTPENIYVAPDRRRRCIECRRDCVRAWRAKKLISE